MTEACSNRSRSFLGHDSLPSVETTRIPMRNKPSHESTTGIATIQEEGTTQVRVNRSIHGSAEFRSTTVDFQVLSLLKTTLILRVPTEEVTYQHQVVAQVVCFPYIRVRLWDWAVLPPLRLAGLD